MFLVGVFLHRFYTSSHTLADTLLSALMSQCLRVENAKRLLLNGPQKLLKGSPVEVLLHTKPLLKNNTHQQRPPTVSDPLHILSAFNWNGNTLPRPPLKNYRRAACNVDPPHLVAWRKESTIKNEPPEVVIASCKHPFFFSSSNLLNSLVIQSWFNIHVINVYWHLYFSQLV